jgi:hypothetical protein
LLLLWSDRKPRTWTRDGLYDGRRTFLDTNVVVDAVDAYEPAKQQAALDAIAALSPGPSSWSGPAPSACATAPSLRVDEMGPRTIA